MRIHYLQHVSFENPGSILEWAKANNGLVTSTQLYHDEALPEVSDFDWLVVMGGPMNIYEEDQYPWLKAEKELIKAAIAANKVVIGVCLGSQLIADIIGGKVVQNNQKEIGWFPITFSEEAKALINGQSAQLGKMMISMGLQAVARAHAEAIKEAIEKGELSEDDSDDDSAVPPNTRLH